MSGTTVQDSMYGTSADKQIVRRLCPGPLSEKRAEKKKSLVCRHFEIPNQRNTRSEIIKFKSFL
jgi:hypothetical protein